MAGMLWKVRLEWVACYLSYNIFGAAFVNVAPTVSLEMILLALAIWAKAIKENSARVTLSTVYMKPWGVGFDAKRASLERLRDAGLIALEMKDGRSPVVMIRY